MKIVVVGSQFPDSFPRNIVVTLEALGHDVVNIRTTRAFHHQNRLAHAFWKYLPLAFPSIDRSVYRSLARRIELFQPDLVLLTFALPPEVLSSIREITTAKIACWFTDAISNLHRGYLIAGAYDALFVKEPVLVPILRDKLGINAHYLPEACNPLWHKPLELTETDRSQFACDIAGIGTLHYYRARMFEPLLSYDLRIWGSNCPPWLISPTRSKYQHRTVAELTKAAALRSAKIVVNTMYFSEIDGVNCSLFEIAGCGAFQLTDWKPTLPHLFEVGTEIVTFESRNDLLEKIDYYLARPEERLSVGANASRRAHRDHTYAHRLKTIFEVLGLTETDRPDAEIAELAELT